MDRIERLFLNLSPEPPRNRNPFRVSFVSLILGILLFLYPLSISFYRGVTSYIENGKAIQNLRKELEKVYRENKELESKIIEFKKIYKNKVEVINTLIEEKNLSWLSLLSIFEESMSDKTVLISLTPFQDSKTLNAEIASESLDDFLETINKLSKNKLVSKVSIVREKEKDGHKIFLITLKLKG